MIGVSNAGYLRGRGIAESKFAKLQDVHGEGV